MLDDGRARGHRSGLALSLAVAPRRCTSATRIMGSSTATGSARSPTVHLHERFSEHLLRRHAAVARRDRFGPSRYVGGVVDRIGEHGHGEIGRAHV